MNRVDGDTSVFVYSIKTARYTSTYSVLVPVSNIKSRLANEAFLFTLLFKIIIVFSVYLTNTQPTSTDQINSGCFLNV